MPALQAAEDALKCLEKKDLDLLKTMKQPPQTIKNVMRALCLILDPNPKEKMKDASGLKFVTDWWAASVRLLNKPGL
jgi:dynein heavy chain, axonemal